MKSASADLIAALNNGTVLKAIPKVIAEWNQNRYAEIQAVSNAYHVKEEDARPLEERECFPIASIAETNRPAKGIIKGEAMEPSAKSLLGYRTARPYTNQAPTSRYYTVGKDAIYKYWTSPYETRSYLSPSGDYEFADGTMVQPYVMYAQHTLVNKIVVGLETSYVYPRRWTISTTEDGTTWQTISSGAIPDANGQVVLYLNPSGTWGKTVYRNTGKTIRGIKVQIFSLGRPETRAHVIEISGRLEHDLSEFVIDMETSFDMDDPNFITPLGTCSANTGSVTLSNIDGRFSNENVNSPYYQLIDKNVMMTGSLVYHLSNRLEEIRSFTMYVDDWGGEGEVESKIELKDYSKFFMEQVTPKRLTQDVTVGEAVWRLCDAVGFVNYKYSAHANAVNTQIPYFWTDGEDTVWEVFQDLAQATQTAIFFDEYGVLQIQTRDRAYDRKKPLTWQFDATSLRGKVADIKEARLTRTHEANHVDVTYKTTKVSEFQGGLPVMEKIWEPEGSFVMRASNLTQNVYPGDKAIRISPKDALTWEYEGMFQVEGEICRYKGKQYAYMKKTGGIGLVVLYSKEEKDHYDSDEVSDPNKKYLNTFTGLLTDVKRGEEGTHATSHWISATKPSVSSTMLGYTNTLERGTNRFCAQNFDRGTVTLGPGDWRGPSDWHSAAYSWTGNTAPSHFGTTFKFKAHHKPGGFYIYGGENDSGYYLEFFTSKIREEIPSVGERRYEIGVVAKKPNGHWARLNAYYEDDKTNKILDITGRGIPYVIAVDVEYDLDVIVVRRYPPDVAYERDVITVYINGSMVGSFEAGVIPGTDWRVAPSGEFGFWVDANGQMEYSHIYAHQWHEDYQYLDGLSVTDRIRGGYASRHSTNFVYRRWKSVGSNFTWQTYPRDALYFDEFGPVVHEVREIEVEFEKTPVLHSRLYVSNEDQIICPSYEADPFSARFVLANASRRDAIGQGEDKITFGAEDPVDQKMMIYGRLVFQEDEETHTVKNEAAIRARGKVDVKIENKWIQNKTEAENLGEWITQNWAGGCDEVDLEVFGNPLIQVGDLVSVHYPLMNMVGETHRYFVVRVEQKFDRGLETNLVLRRAYPATQNESIAKTIKHVETLREQYPDAKPRPRVVSKFDPVAS